MNEPTEHELQCDLFQRLAYHSKFIPELKFVHASLSGVFLPIGIAMKCKKAGLSKGHPDISFPLKRGKYSGLYIEMKRPKKKLTPEQKEFFEFATAQGFKCLICFSGVDAFNAILDYYKLTSPKKQAK